MLHLILLAVIFATLLYYYGIKPMSYWTEKGVKQGRTFWIVGDNWRNLLRLEGISDMVARVYSQVSGVRYSGMYQFTTPTLVLRDPDLIKQITVKDFDHFLDHRTLFTEEMEPLFGKNLFNLKGQRWRDMRSILSPSFTGSKMRSMFKLMSDCAENLREFFVKQNQDIVEVEMKNVFTRYTNDIIATTAFGIKTDSLQDQTNEFYMMGKEITNFTSWWKNLKMFLVIFMPKIAKIFKVSIFKSRVTHFFSEIINNTIKLRQEKGIIRPDMIHLMLEAQKGKEKKESESISESNPDKSLTNSDIVAQALIFFIAGFDGVAGLMSFMSHELAVNPDVQKKLRHEIRETFEECNGDLTYDALNKMKYMDMVLSETLRKWPTAVMADRVCTKPYTIQSTSPEEKPVHLSKGDVVWLPIFGIHRDPEIYPDPDRFDPERFSEENKGKISPYSYMPFGVGPRICIGNRFAMLETKVAIFHLLTHFEMVPISKTVIPLEVSKWQFSLQPDEGFWVGLKRIQK